MVHGYTDVVVEQDEVFLGVTVAPFDVDVAGHTEEERLTMTEHRWWTRDELASDHRDDLARGRCSTCGTGWTPGAEAVDLGTQEESTVPVRRS